MISRHVTIYSANGKQELTWEEWINLDDSSFVFHRLDGPARIFEDSLVDVELSKELLPDPYALFSSLLDRDWFLGGELFTKEGHAQLVQEVRDMPLVLRLVDPRKWVREFK